jgi:hypothetical protein
LRLKSYYDFLLISKALQIQMKSRINQSILHDTLASLWTQFRAAFMVPVIDRKSATSKKDSDFERWLHHDPFVIRNPGNRYGERSPGYATRSGLGSLEIGAADD